MGGLSAIVTGTVGLMSLKEIGANAAAISAVLVLAGLCWRWKPVRDLVDWINKHRAEDRKVGFDAMLQPYVTTITDKLDAQTEQLDTIATTVTRELKPNGTPMVDKVDAVLKRLDDHHERIANLERKFG